MKVLNKPGDNLGGVIRFWAIPPDDVIGIGSTISVSSTSNIIEMYCSIDSMNFSEKPKRSDAGLSYEAELSGFMPHDSPEANDLIFEMQNERYVVLFVDGNNQSKVVGVKDNAMHVEFDHETGKSTENLNGHAVRFYSNQKSKAVFVSNRF